MLFSEPVQRLMPRVTNAHFAVFVDRVHDVATHGCSRSLCAKSNRIGHRTRAEARAEAHLDMARCADRFAVRVGAQRRAASAQANRPVDRCRRHSSADLHHQESKYSTLCAPQLSRALTPRHGENADASAPQLLHVFVDDFRILGATSNVKSTQVSPLEPHL